MALQARLTISGRVQGVGYRDWAITTGAPARPHRLGAQPHATARSRR